MAMDTHSDPTVVDVRASLDRMAPGSRCQVADLDREHPSCQRLMEMGLVPGGVVTIEHQAPFGDPISCRVRGYHLSLRRAQATAVRVRRLAVGGAEAVDPELSAPPAELPPGAEAPPVNGLRHIAMAGNPNVGKTTLFNQITGLRQKVANYPGVTVERKAGRCRLPDDSQAVVLDLPGAYSLTPASEDERIAAQVVLGQLPGEAQPDVVCLVVDASNLARNLYLFSQIADCGLPMVVALNMVDIAKQHGCPVDAKALERCLGVPVVPVIARTGSGVMQLGEALTRARIPDPKVWRLPEEACLDGLVTRLQQNHLEPAGPLARLLFNGDGLRPMPGGDEVIAVQLHQLRQEHPQLAAAMAQHRFAWIESVLAECVAPTSAELGPTASERWDRLLLHPIFGLAAFGLTMWALFALVFTVADPLMGIFETLFEGPGAAIGGLLPAGPLRDLWVEGVVGGVGGVLVFVPQIAFLFLGLALLESSGYLARGAFLLDRALVKVGLHGKSFVPMLSSHACAIPGIMATRAMEDHRDRLVTMLVAPLMVCAARLPVYGLLIAFFFAQYSGFVQGSILFGLYAFGIVAAVGIALLLRRGALGGGSSSFLMELPTYKWPGLRSVLRTVLTNVGIFVKKAGTIILAFSIILWVLNRYPELPETEQQAVVADYGLSLGELDDPAAAPTEQRQEASYALAAARSEHSLAGRAGHLLEPIVAPMGFDWKMGVGLIGAFAAREVFISTISIVYANGDEVEEVEQLSALQQAMAADSRDDGSPMWSLPVGISLLVWFAIAMQCISTTAIMVRESGGWKWPLLQLAGFNLIAYALCIIIYQIGSRL